MAAKVVWLDQAKDDLRAILDYIYQRNPSTAFGYGIGSFGQKQKDRTTISAQKRYAFDATWCVVGIHVRKT